MHNIDILAARLLGTALCDNHCRNRSRNLENTGKQLSVDCVARHALRTGGSYGSLTVDCSGRAMREPGFRLWLPVLPWKRRGGL
jgi:hypothetical protein